MTNTEPRRKWSDLSPFEQDVHRLISAAEWMGVEGEKDPWDPKRYEVKIEGCAKARDKVVQTHSDTAKALDDIITAWGGYCDDGRLNEAIEKAQRVREAQKQPQPQPATAEGTK